MTKTAAKTQKREKKVFVVDDHPILRQGLMQMISQEAGLNACGSAENSAQALEQIKALAPQLVVVDLSLKDESGMDLIKEIHARYNDLAMLVVSMHDEAFYAERALRAGARGYVMKQETTETILKAIHQVLNGEIYLSEKMGKKLLQTAVSGKADSALSPVERLTDRELQVFQSIGKGLSASQIADQMFLSVKTVESYSQHLKEKLGLENASELRQYAIRWIQSRTAI